MAENLGAQIDALYAHREKIRALEAKMKTLKETKYSMEEGILELLSSEELDQASGKKATASISLTTVGQLKDLDKLKRFIKQNDAFDLFERRISSVAFRDWLEKRKNKPIPGVEKFVKKALKLNVRG